MSKMTASKMTMSRMTMDRRTILRMAAAGGAAAGFSTLAGCSAGGGADGREGWKTAPWATGPVSFVFLTTIEPSGLDPSKQYEFDAQTVVVNAYDALTVTDEAAQELKPALATEWTANDDLTEWVFTLREGVRFHDGSMLDAEGVALAMQRHLAVGAEAQASFMLEGIEDVRAVGPMAVKFSCSISKPWMAEQMAMFPIMSAQAIKEHGTDGDQWAEEFFESNCVGTGPYTFAEWQRGTKITMEKFEDWWNGPWEAGSIDTVIVQWTNNPATAVDLISGGSADFTTTWTVDSALKLADQPGFTLEEFNASYANPLICMNQAREPFDRLEVRQAFQLAFDYEAMQNYFRGYSVIPSGVMPATEKWALPSLKPFERDVDGALKLLHDAGIDPKSLRPTCLAASGYADLMAGGAILQSSLADIGVEVEVKNVPFSTIVSMAAEPETAPELTSSLYNGIFSLDPTSYLASFLPGVFGSEFMNYESETLIAAHAEASSATDEAVIKRALDTAQQAIRDDAPVIFGGLPDFIVPVPDYVDGYVMQYTYNQYPCMFGQLRIREH